MRPFHASPWPIVALVLLLFVPVAAVADEAPDLETRIAGLFDELRRSDAPGGVVAAIRDGEIVHETAFGMADLERGVLHDSSMPDRIRRGATPPAITASMSDNAYRSTGSSSLDIGSLFGLSGKVAVVTGGSRGIGYMIAAGLVQNGVRVYITARKAEACDAAAGELSEFGDCISIPADLARADGLAHFVEEFTSREDQLDTVSYTHLTLQTTLN